MSEVHPPAALLPEKEENEEEEALRDAGVEICLHSLQPSSNQQAPVELLAEVGLSKQQSNPQSLIFPQFLRCVMSEEYIAAKILCNKGVPRLLSFHQYHKSVPVSK